MLAYSKTRPVRDGLKQQKNAQSKSSLPTEARKRLYHSRRSRPLFQRKTAFPSCRAIKPCKPRLKALSKRKTAATTITGQNGRNTAAYRLSRAISTRFYARNASSVKKQRNRSDKNRPQMYPNPYRTRGLPRTLSAIPKDFLTGLQAEKPRK